jgi:NADH-quinone oxidoreductase subunit N
MTQSDVIALLPLVIVACWAVLLLLVDLWIPVDRKGITAFLAALGLAAALGFNIAHSDWSMVAFKGLAVLDGFTVFLDTIFLFSGLAAIGLAYDYLKRMEIERGEYYPLLLLSISGMLMMTYANDLIIVFLSLELLSIPLYIMAGLAHPRTESEESSLKYFLLGTFAAAFVLYGIALIFGATGHTGLQGVVLAASSGALLNNTLFLVGAGLLLVGFAFKTAIVPFHGWAPDVYQGAPTPVTGFMAIGAKTAGIAALLRVFVVAFPSISVDLTPVLWVLAAVTMIFGNVVAVAQKNIKRLLGYSSIANGGYLLMAFVTFGNGELMDDTISAMVFFLLGYAVTSFAAWGVVIALEKGESRGLELDDYAGLGKKYPWLALAMMIAMLSFTGVPLTLGFWGKFYLFRTAVEGGYPWLALIGLLTSVVSAYYYLRVVVIMYMRPGEPQASKSFWLNLVTIGSALAVVGLSFIPGSLLYLAVKAVIR